MNYEMPSEFASAVMSYRPGSRIVDHLNKVLRGELAAVEAYDQALQRITDETTINRLSAIRNDHVDSVRTLKNMISHEGAFPDEGPGVWGAVVRAIIGAGKLLGEATTLNALKQGEERGLTLYEALAKENLNLADLNLIKTKLIPRQERHIAILSQLTQMH